MGPRPAAAVHLPMTLYHACRPCFVRCYSRALPSVVHSQPTDPSDTCDSCGAEGVPGFRVDAYSLGLVRAAMRRPLRSVVVERSRR